METTYILIGIVALLIIAAVAFFVRKNKKQEKLSPLAGLSFMFVIAGIIFSDDRMIGYGLMGVGIILAFADILMKLRIESRTRSKRPRKR